MVHLVSLMPTAMLFISITFMDAVYFSYQDDTLPVGQYRIEYLLTPTSADPDNFDSYQHLKVNLLLAQVIPLSQPLLQLDSRICEAA